MALTAVTLQGHFAGSSCFSESAQNISTKMASQRKFVVGGNWKMNGDKASIDGIIAFLNAGPLDENAG